MCPNVVGRQSEMTGNWKDRYGRKGRAQCRCSERVTASFTFRDAVHSQAAVCIERASGGRRARPTTTSARKQQPAAMRTHCPAGRGTCATSANVRSPLPRSREAVGSGLSNTLFPISSCSVMCTYGVGEPFSGSVSMAKMCQVRFRARHVSTKPFSELLFSELGGATAVPSRA